MPNIHGELKKEFQLERMILFSDAVFAIAITLLILEIKVPQIQGGITEANLLDALAGLIPKFIGFFISFFLIGLYWTIHHRLFGLVVNYDTKLLWLNLVFLASIVLIPFSTAFYSEYFSTELIYLKTPLVFYALNMLFVGVMNYFLWGYIGNPARHLSEGIPDKHFIAYSKTRALIVPAVFLLSIPVAFIQPHVARDIPILLPVVMTVFQKKIQ